MKTGIIVVQVLTASAFAEIQQSVKACMEQGCQEMAERIVLLMQEDVSSQAFFEFENELADIVRRMAREVLQWTVENLEDDDQQQLPERVEFEGDCFRKLADSTVRRNVVSQFGEIQFSRSRYRQGRSGVTIFPLEIQLGLTEGFTPAAASLVGQQFAATGSSQQRTLDMIRQRFGISTGIGKLRKLVQTLANVLEPLREEVQVQQLHEWIKQVRGDGQQPVLGVSRDGVSLGIAAWSHFEMASVASITVFGDGKKRGTVYLGQTPEMKQQTLSKQLTSLLKATVRMCGDDVPDVVYVTDAGKVETSYWKNTLRVLFVDGVRIKVTRVVDYYHASSRLSTIANGLKLSKSARENWVKRMRSLLKEPGGTGRVLRSASAMRRQHGVRWRHKTEMMKAEAYLRRHSRYMKYADAKAQGWPIGSGIVESACKQIVSERMKLSGMRWSHAGAQTVMTIRCLYLSGIWDRIYSQWLSSRTTVKPLISQSNA